MGRFEAGVTDVVVHSDLANGKSLLLEEVAAYGAQLGYDAYIYSEPGREAASELELVAKSSGTHPGRKTLLCVDDYTDKRDELELFFRNCAADVFVVYAARSLRHDAAREWLEERLGTESVSEVHINRLTDKEIAECSSLLETSALWGEHLAGYAPERREQHIRQKCERQVSGVLLDILKSQQVAERLATLVRGISREEEKYVVASAAILMLSVLKQPTNTHVLMALIGGEILNTSKFRNNESIRQIFDIRTGEVGIRNAVVARHILRRTVNPRQGARALGDMAAKAESLREDSDYYKIFKELMQFRNVQEVLPEQGRMDAVVGFYERMKNLRGCKRNPQFWLQYGIARMSLKQYIHARKMLETAFAHAKKRQRFDTYMLDNTRARLELEEKIAVPATELPAAMEAFRKAKNIINRQVQDHDQRRYAFRVAASYEPFYRTHESLLDEKSELEVRGAAKKIQKLLGPADAEEDRYHRACREAMNTLLGSEQP